MEGSTDDYSGSSSNDSPDCCEYFPYTRVPCWWNASQSSLLVSFCNDTSIHGLKFIGQEKRHFTERAFWLLGFLGSFGAAIWLIWGVWDRYIKVPVVVTFDAQDLNIDSIPFPAVTICNVNQFSKSKVEELQKIVMNQSSSAEERKKAKVELGHVSTICNIRQSFAKKMGYAFHRGTINNSFSHEVTSNESESQLDAVQFLLEKTLSCQELLRLCLLGNLKINCSTIFRPIVTDNGKCCTFNVLPLPSLLHNPNESPKAPAYDNPMLGKTARQFWPMEDLQEWGLWNYEEHYVMHDQSLKKPWRQKRAGAAYGLSVLLDPNMDEYFCPVSDSEGLLYVLHSPLELPKLAEFGSAIHVDKEIWVEVTPDVTTTDDDIRDIEYDKRKCHFGKNDELRFFGPYTQRNCGDECMTDTLIKICGCTQFYLPRNLNVRVCDSHPESQDYQCSVATRANISLNFHEFCPICGDLCEKVVYKYETTMASLQNQKVLWEDPNTGVLGNASKSWASHRMSILHIYYGSQSAVPKLRKRRQGATDLLGIIGGILGLCLGVSFLSALEVVYYSTLRCMWKYCRKRNSSRRRDAGPESYSIISRLFSEYGRKPRSKVVKLEADKLKVYTHNMLHKSAAGFNTIPAKQNNNSRWTYQ